MVADGSPHCAPALSSEGAGQAGLHPDLETEGLAPRSPRPRPALARHVGALIGALSGR